MEINESICEWFARAIPEPTKDSQRVQLGVHIEEFLEMFEGITIRGEGVESCLVIGLENLHKLATALKTNPKIEVDVTDHLALLDSLCDQQVTSNGVGHLYGYKMVPALFEVDESNWSKFVNGMPIFNEFGKIAKGLEYFKPNLEPYIPHH